MLAGQEEQIDIIAHIQSYLQPLPDSRGSLPEEKSLTVTRRFLSTQNVMPSNDKTLCVAGDTSLVMGAA